MYKCLQDTGIKAAVEGSVDHSGLEGFIRLLWSRDIIVDQHILWGDSGSSFVVWICSDLPRVRASLRYPSLFPSSPNPPPPLPVVTFACSLSPLTPPHLILSPTLNPPTSVLFLPSSHPSLLFLPSFLPHPPPLFTSSPRGHVAHLGDDEDEDDDGADDDETHTQ